MIDDGDDKQHDNATGIILTDLTIATSTAAAPLSPRQFGSQRLCTADAWTAAAMAAEAVNRIYRTSW